MNAINPAMGDIVDIYEYPLSNEEHVGRATLLTLVNPNVFYISSEVKLQRWHVRFENGDMEERYILAYLSSLRQGEHYEF